MSGTSTRASHRAALAGLPAAQWAAYLAENSGLPGPRANLDLAQAVADEASPEQITALADSADEYTALCGAVALGRLWTDGSREESEARLLALAEDPRWRVREGVAMALQRLGDADRDALWELAERWVERATAARQAPRLLLLRAVAAGVAEPRLVKAAPDARRALRILDRVTAALAGLPASERRGRDDVRVLRQTLGYAWSVAAVGVPAEGFEALERLAALGDPDMSWIVRSNATRSRLARLDPDRAAALRGGVG